MEEWPDFVTDAEKSTIRSVKELTGWETVVFEIEDVQNVRTEDSPPCGGSAIDTHSRGT